VLSLSWRVLSQISCPWIAQQWSQSTHLLSCGLQGTYDVRHIIACQFIQTWLSFGTSTSSLATSKYRYLPGLHLCTLGISANCHDNDTFILVSLWSSSRPAYRCQWWCSQDEIGHPAAHAMQSQSRNFMSFYQTVASCLGFDVACHSSNIASFLTLLFVEWRVSFYHAWQVTKATAEHLTLANAGHSRQRQMLVLNAESSMTWYASLCIGDPNQWSTYLDVGILFVLNCHDNAVISPGCHFKYVRHAVLCNDQAVVPSSQEGIWQPLQAAELSTQGSKS